MSERNERLSDGLEEGQRKELGDLSSLVSFLEGYTVPEPSPEQKTELVARLEVHLEGGEEFANQRKGSTPFEDRSQLLNEPGIRAAPTSLPLGSKEGLRKWIRLACSQALLFETPFWWACGIVLALGLVIVSLSGDGLPVLIFLGLAPLLAAIGVAYSFRPETQTLWELEKISPISSVELLYTRLGLVLAINTAISLVLLGVVWGHGLHLVLWRLVLAWLGPMLALAGCALYISIRWGSVVGIVAPLGLWGIVNFLGWRQAVERVTETQLAALWLVDQINQSNLLLIFFLLALVVGLVLLQRAGTLTERGELEWR
jgi:hypothetical protein